MDFGGILRPGDAILVSQASAEPLTLTEALVAQRHAIGGVSVFLGVQLTDTFRPEHADALRFSSFGAMEGNFRLAEAGKLDLFPVHYSEVPRLIESGRLRCDVALLSLSPPGPDGRSSIGVCHDWMLEAARRARVVIAEVNERMPWTYGSEELPEIRIERMVQSSRALPVYPPPEIGETERAIACRAASYIEDGAVLEMGIGAIPSAILAQLSDRRDLGVHSGLLTDSVVELIERGVVTNSRKTIDRGHTVTGMLWGSEKLYRLAERNPAIRLRPIRYTHDLSVIASIDNFVGINGAVEVDLTGQINAEMAGRHYVGGIGGQGDFMRGALLARGGRSIIALPSTTRDGARSRIVARIDSGVVTTARADADVIVTEWGAAELRGATIPERIARMLAIAHPKHREALERALRDFR